MNIFLCWSQRTQHAVVPEDPAAALGPVHTDLQPVPPPLPDPPWPPLQQPAGSRGSERRGRTGLHPRGRLGIPPAVRGVCLLLILILLFFRRVQSGKKDFKSRKLPLHEPDEAQRSDAPQQQQRGPQEQADPVPGRPDQYHERALWCGQSQKPARQSGWERAPPGSDWTEKVNTDNFNLTDSHDQCWPRSLKYNEVLCIHFKVTVLICLSREFSLKYSLTLQV